MTNRTIRNISVLFVLLTSVVIGATTLYFYKQYGLKILLALFYIALILFVVAVVVSCLYIFVIKKGFKNFIEEERIINNLEQNLISIGAYYKTETSNIYYLPKIKVFLDGNCVSIRIDDIKIRKLIESYEDKLSSALPSHLVVKDYYVSNTGNEFIISYRNEATDKQKAYSSLNSYLPHIKQLDKLCYEVDDEHIINLLDYPHFLIGGSTGSGKTYLAQLLIIQFISKGFNVSVYDVKKSYSAFSDYVDVYETDPFKILEKLKEVCEEMKERQNNLEQILKHDPRALAVNYGYQPKVIFIEEYIGLKTMLDKSSKELDNLVKEISVLARSVNISLFIITQSSNVDTIDASIKNNLNKIFLGYLASNISVSTFGAGVDVPLFTQLEKGNGYIQLDRVEQIRVPKIVYSVNELETIKAVFCEGKA